MGILFNFIVVDGGNNDSGCSMVVTSCALANANNPETNCDIEPIIPNITININIDRIKAKLSEYGYVDIIFIIIDDDATQFFSLIC